MVLHDAIQAGRNSGSTGSIGDHLGHLSETTVPAHLQHWLHRNQCCHPNAIVCIDDLAGNSVQAWAGRAEGETAVCNFCVGKGCRNYHNLPSLLFEPFYPASLDYSNN